MARKKDGYTITGPNVERASPGYGAGLSIMQTLATRAASEITLYLHRNTDDEIVARVERDEEGIIRTYRIAGAVR